MAPKKKAAPVAKDAGTFEIFTLAGVGKNRVAINPAAISAIEEDGPQHRYVQVGTVRYRIVSGDTLEDLLGLDAPAAAD